MKLSVVIHVASGLCSHLSTSLLYSRIPTPARSRSVLNHNCHQPTTHQVPPHLFAELMRTIDKADLYRREGNQVTGFGVHGNGTETDGKNHTLPPAA
jgi:hypothetical protein